MKLLLDIKETVGYVSLSESKIKRMVAEGRFPKPLIIDGNVRYKVKDIDSWADQLSAGEVPPPKAKRGRPRLAV
jgi:predicted DNA-binding transcriptional regulator AlpA